MRDTRRPEPTGDLDTPAEIAEIAEMVRRFHADVAHDDLLGPMFNDVPRVGWIGLNARLARDLADNVARVHSHQLLGQAVSIDSDASTE